MKTSSLGNLVAEGATGWTREVEFNDRRSPLDLQAVLEEAWMAPFAPVWVGHILVFKGELDLTGVHYQVEVAFLDVGPRGNHFRLRTMVSWEGAAALYHDYFRRTSEGWFALWTQRLKETRPRGKSQREAGSYAALCSEVLTAQEGLNSPVTLKQRIVDGLKQGGTFSTAHKEGGTRISWITDRYVRSDYGECPERSVYESDADLLAMLWRLLEPEVARQAGPAGHPEAATWRLIWRQMSRN